MIKDVIQLSREELKTELQLLEALSYTYWTDELWVRLSEIRDEILTRRNVQ